MVRLPRGLEASSPPGATRSARSGAVACVTTQSVPLRARQPTTRTSALAGSSVLPSFGTICTPAMVLRPKLGGSRGKAVGFQHQRDDVRVGGFAERTGGAVRHVGADELQQIADGFLRETLPECVAHQGRLAFCRQRMTTRAALAEGRMPRAA